MKIIYLFFTKMLLRLHAKAYSMAGRLAVKSEGGLHPKHRLTRYHDFFVNHIQAGQRVLDIGCGCGQVILKTASQKKVGFTGVDISEGNIKSAREFLKGFPDVVLVCADIWKYEAAAGFDVIIMSNVLEHLKNRTELLRSLTVKFKPAFFLIRIPMLERDWMVPYKKELGIEWRLDQTHETEYTESEIRKELGDAGLEIESISFRWSEMYIKAVPQKG